MREYAPVRSKVEKGKIRVNKAGWDIIAKYFIQMLIEVNLCHGLIGGHIDP